MNLEDPPLPLQQLMRQLNENPSNLEPIRSTRTPHPLIKTIVSLLLITAYITYRILYPQPQVVCIRDAYQDSTENWNRQLVEDKNNSAYQGNNNQLTSAGKGFIGTGQVMMDMWIFILGLVWILKVKNLRAFLAAGLFFGIRGVIFLNIQKFPFPEHMAWRSPGFFSFTVPYDHTRDFFYSGHTGSLTVIFLEMMTLDQKILYVLAFLSLLFMMNLLLITKVHYVVDIVGGLVMAAFFFRLSTRLVVYFDKLVSLPYFGVKWIYYNHCLQEEVEKPPQIVIKLQKGNTLDSPVIIEGGTDSKFERNEDRQSQ